MPKRKEIRNSTAEFLIFQAEDKGQGIEVYYKDENVWCTQKAMATLFDVNVPAISKHLKNIFETNELQESSTVSKMEIVQMEGTREVKRETSHNASVFPTYTKQNALCCSPAYCC